jgi:hypothetical protein
MRTGWTMVRGREVNRALKAESSAHVQVSTGAQNDLEKITQMAYSTVAVYGMNDRVGLVSFPPDKNRLDKPYSDETAKLIDEEARKIIKSCYENTLQLLQDKRAQVEALAQVSTKLHLPSDLLHFSRRFNQSSLYHSLPTSKCKICAPCIRHLLRKCRRKYISQPMLAGLGSDVAGGNNCAISAKCWAGDWSVCVHAECALSFYQPQAQVFHQVLNAISSTEFHQALSASLPCVDRALSISRGLCL